MVVPKECEEIQVEDLLEEIELEELLAEDDGIDGMICCEEVTVVDNGQSSDILCSEQDLQTIDKVINAGEHNEVDKMGVPAATFKSTAVVEQDAEKGQGTIVDEGLVGESAEVIEQNEAQEIIIEEEIVTNFDGAGSQQVSNILPKKIRIPSI